MDFKDLSRKLAQLVENIGNKETMEKIGENLAETIKNRTRKGFGVFKTKGRKERLKKLSGNYINKRKRLKKNGDLSQETTVSKSNLTQKGTMLNNINERSKYRETEVFVTGAKNIKKALDQKEQGREFMNVSKSEFADTVNIIEKDLKNDIKKKGL